ncbi:MAG: cytochrome c oxidase subunit I, partial [Planctomyces sp.]|nr:cytochrome c oxidase subunit I [Planctomyces sp.]
MATIVENPIHAGEGAGSEPYVDNYLTFTRGWKSWAFTLDHKRIGVMYLFATLGAFFV